MEVLSYPNFGLRIKMISIPNKLIKVSTSTLVIIWLTGFSLSAQSQRNSSSAFKDLPQESIYLHQNSSLLLAGERLYYKAYCRKLNSGMTSNLSKMAYVSLIDENLQLVFEHKIRLEDGTGQGDFVIPAEVATGSYKLIGYTRWMLNSSQDQIFESDLFIINPYKTTGESYLVPVEIDSSVTDSIPVRQPVARKQIVVPDELGVELLELELGKKEYSSRSPISLKIRGLSSDAINGSYSLTVRKRESGLPESFGKPMSNRAQNGNKALQAGVSIKVMPEMRGELISGRVIEKSSGNAVPGKQVVLSIPGDPYLFELAQSNEEGRFYFNLDTSVSASEAIFQIMDREKELFEIELDEYPLPKLDILEFTGFKLDKSMEKSILARSIHNQIENAYASVKSDTIVRKSELLPFYRNYQKSYFLDDFTRFNTLRETMVEIVDNAWIDENGSDDPTFGVRPLDGYLDVGSLLPAVFIDGLFVQDHKNIVDYNSKEVRRIFVTRDRFMAGPRVFQGILSLETKSGEFYKSLFREHLYNKELIRPEPARSYFFEQHLENRNTNRLPDFRYQLFWTPNIELNKGTTEIEFYSSDIKGDFLIEIRGFSATGKPVLLLQSITVE